MYKRQLLFTLKEINKYIKKPLDIKAHQATLSTLKESDLTDNYINRFFDELPLTKKDYADLDKLYQEHKHRLPHFRASYNRRK